MDYGLLNLNKPAGMTSRDVVNLVQRLVRPAKVGHAGTLDPLATGVLVVATGPATRLVPYVQRQPKSYTATFLLGRQSATEDVEGTGVELPGARQPSLAELQAAAARLVGTIDQRPPAYSALKVQGQRAYKLARRGEAPAMESRPVTIHEIKITGYSYPELTLEVRCGSGTYVRSLGRDLAESAGTAAVMAALVRTAIGPFRLEDAVQPESLSEANLGQCLLPPLWAVGQLPQVAVGEAEAARLRCGGRVAAAAPLSGEVAVVDRRGRLIGIATVGGHGVLAPVCNLPSGED